MRICKIEPQETTLEEVMQEFLSYKLAQQISERTMKDYRRYLEDFLKFSRNSLNERVLKKDI